MADKELNDKVDQVVKRVVLIVVLFVAIVFVYSSIASQKHNADCISSYGTPEYYESC